MCPAAALAFWQKSRICATKAGTGPRSWLLATQSAILDTAAQLLKAGGRLVYSTCTIDPAENQQQIAAFLARHPEFTVVEPAAALPAGMTAGEHGALSVPTRTGMDGFFLCAMQKNGEKLQ